MTWDDFMCADYTGSILFNMRHIHQLSHNHLLHCQKVAADYYTTEEMMQFKKKKRTTKSRKREVRCCFEKQYSVNSVCHFLFSTWNKQFSGCPPLSHTLTLSLSLTPLSLSNHVDYRAQGTLTADDLEPLEEAAAPAAVKPETAYVYSFYAIALFFFCYLLNLCNLFLFVNRQCLFFFLMFLGFGPASCT